MINHHQRVVLNSPCDCPQNCLFAAFTPLLILDGAIRLSLSFSLVFFVFQGVEGSPGVPAKARTCLPFIEEGVVTFWWLLFNHSIPSVSILAIDLNQWSRSHPFASGSYHTPWNCQSTPGQGQTRPRLIAHAPGSIPRAHQPIGTHGSPMWPGHCPDPAQLPMT